MPIQPYRNQMPSQDPKDRAHNFDEVAFGYPLELALNEAQRCLDCKNAPCISGCPVNVKIPDFIRCLKNGNVEEAYRIISDSSSLPAVCGRVCPQESQCEKKCTLGIKFEPVAIGRLERFVADYHLTHNYDEVCIPQASGFRVAVIGSGPSGLTCAGDLAKLGHHVTIFEALHTAGGVLVYGIPEFRLPKAIVAKEIDGLKKLGVEIMTNVVIGKTLTIDELFQQGYDAVFIGSGAGLPMFLGIEGEGLCGVYSANEFLTRSNLMKAYREDAVTPIMKGGRVVVVGGGNVAMDAARTALRLGADEVHVVYRRSLEELPARKEEVEHAMEEGILFDLLCDPIKICGYYNENDPKDPKNGFVNEIICRRMSLGDPDERGRRRPIPIENSEFVISADTVIISIGTSPNPLIKNTTHGLDVNQKGGIIVDENGLTSRDAVFAGGDAVTGAATVISAMGAGKKAANTIHAMLTNKK